MDREDDLIAEIQAEEFYANEGADPYDRIPFGDAQRYEDEQVFQDIAAGEGREDQVEYDDSMADEMEQDPAEHLGYSEGRDYGDEN